MVIFFIVSTTLISLHSLSRVNALNEGGDFRRVQNVRRGTGPRRRRVTVDLSGPVKRAAILASSAQLSSAPKPTQSIYPSFEKKLNNKVPRKEIKKNISRLQR